MGIKASYPRSPYPPKGPYEEVYVPQYTYSNGINSHNSIFFKKTTVAVNYSIETTIIIATTMLIIIMIWVGFSNCFFKGLFIIIRV